MQASRRCEQRRCLARSGVTVQMKNWPLAFRERLADFGYRRLLIVAEYHSISHRPSALRATGASYWFGSLEVTARHALSVRDTQIRARTASPAPIRSAATRYASCASCVGNSPTAPSLSPPSAAGDDGLRIRPCTTGQILATAEGAALGRGR